MSIQVVTSQMSVMFIFIVIGYFMAKRGSLTPGTCKQISGMIVNVCSPAMMIASVLASESKADMQLLMKVLMVIVIAYVVQILLGFFMGRILRAPRTQWDHYNMMTVFRNIGFVGFPVVNAVLGPEYMIYAVIYNLVFNFLIYTYGIMIISSSHEGGHQKFEWKKLLNIGNFASVASIIIYIFHIQLPDIASSALQYMANTVTFLSVLIIGASVAALPLKSIFTDMRMYAFIVLRMVLFPIALALILKHVFQDSMIVGVLVLLTGMPAANLPLMMAETYDQDTTVLSKGIVLSTLCSVVTITFVALFV